MNMTRDDFYAKAKPGSKGPLEGVRVLEATNYGAGPFCGTVLADFGAESIKIEMPKAGDPVRALGPFVGGKPGMEAGAWYLSINRNKKCITLDLHRPEGQAIFRELAKQADIVVENFTPGVMAGWGLGYDDIAKIKSDIIYVSVSGFGQFGPLSHRKGFDPVAQAMGGIMGMMPGMGKMKDQMAAAGLDDRMFKRQLAIISSMTRQERASPDILKHSRKKRIAAGSGTDAAEINKLLKMHRGMADMMKAMGGKGKGGGMMRGLMGGLASKMGMGGLMGGGMPDLSNMDPKQLEALKKQAEAAGLGKGLPGGLGGLPGGLPGLGGGGLPGLPGGLKLPGPGGPGGLPGPGKKK